MFTAVIRRFFHLHSTNCFQSKLNRGILKKPQVVLGFKGQNLLWRSRTEIGVLFKCKRRVSSPYLIDNKISLKGNLKMNWPNLLCPIQASFEVEKKNLKTEIEQMISKGDLGISDNHCRESEGHTCIVGETERIEHSSHRGSSRHWSERMRFCSEKSTCQNSPNHFIYGGPVSLIKSQTFTSSLQNQENDACGRKRVKDVGGRPFEFL